MTPCPHDRTGLCADCGVTISEIVGELSRRFHGIAPMVDGAIYLDPIIKTTIDILGDAGYSLEAIEADS